VRTVGDENEPRRFSTWAAKAVALIGHLPDTLADRSLVVPMRRRAAGEHVERLRLDRAGGFEDLRRRAARWAADRLGELRGADPEVPGELGDRAADNCGAPCWTRPWCSRAMTREWTRGRCGPCTGHTSCGCCSG
jgi:hypothetical protein